MRYIRRVALGLLLLAIVLVGSACTVSQALTIDGSGAGTATVNVNLSPMLLAYYSDLMSAVTGVSGDYPVFDLDQLAAEFAERPSLDLVDARRSARGRLRLEVAFEDLNEVMADAAESSSSAASESVAEVFTFSERGAQRVLTVRLDREAVNRFVGFSPAESAQMMQFLLPPDDGSISSTEYRGELAWAFEEYGPAEEVVTVLDQSAIEVSVQPSGRIQSQTGGVVRGDTVVFRVPILELLTLAEQRVYEVVFVP